MLESCKLFEPSCSGEDSILISSNSTIKQKINHQFATTISWKILLIIFILNNLCCLSFGNPERRKHGPNTTYISQVSQK